MNKAITDGLVLMPPPFASGLSVWSSGDGTPGSDTYAGSGGGSFVPADQDFADCLEITKSAAVQKLRYMGETTILPGCYLRVTARVKAVAGALPSVRIAGWPGGAGGVHVSGVTETGPAVTLTQYGVPVEVSAIIGTGQRTGVDLFWPNVIYGHLGLDLTGPTGGTVRIDDIVIEDVTSVFMRDMLSVVDVRDHGARGDGVTDDSAAFLAADAAAAGRQVLVSEGVYYLGQNVTISSAIRFEGKVTMPADKRLILQRNYDYNTYLDAFGDEELAFRKAYQALLNFTDHESLDLCGRRINLTGPVDMQAAEGSKTSFATRRVIRNGQIQAVDGPGWAPVVVSATATYAATDPLRLTGVSNAASIPVGALVEGAGVGREVYVRAVNTATATITLSAELHDAEGTQAFTFTRFKYMLDFSGYSSLSSFILDDIEFQCSGLASGIMLALDGLIFQLRDCYMTKPRDRGITSIGTGCQGMLIDRCQFLSNEQSLSVDSRTTVAINANANDIKLRDNRIVMFKHFAVLCGTGNLITGNHWFHGDNTPAGVRKGGVILTTPNCKTAVTGNYIDNNFIEWTNEHSASPALGTQYSFGGLTVTGNIFTCNDVANWFNFIVIKPFGAGHFVHGLAVVGNVFRALSTNIDRIERVDTTFAGLDMTRMRNIVFEGNMFNGINQPVFNPLSMSHVQSTADRNWVVNPGDALPFQAFARVVEAVQPEGKIADAANAAVAELPYAEPSYGATKRQFRLIWKTAVTGTVRARVRIDNPT